MGPEAGPILRQFSLLEEEEKTFLTVKENLTSISSPEETSSLVLYLCRHRKDSESAETFIRSLYTLSEHRCFGDRGDNKSSTN
jgi:hypothetical protein